MGKILFLLLALVFSFKIFSEKGIKKLVWFFAGILFFPSTIILINEPLVSFPRLLIYALLFSTLLQKKRWFAEFKKFPIRNALILLLILLLMIGIFDERLSYFHKIYRPVVYFLERFFILFMVYLYVRSKEDLLYFYNKMLFFFVFICAYGIVNFVLKSNPYSSFISQTYSGVDIGNVYTGDNSTRFRISSFTWHAIYYGLLLATMILTDVFLIYAKETSRKKIKTLIGILFLLVVNLLFANSRTPILSLAIGLMIYFLFAINFQKKVKLLFAGLLCVVAVAFVSPDSVKIIDDTLNTFSSSGQQMEGSSSIEMRKAQLAASIAVFLKSPIHGNGFEYISENLGFTRDKSTRTSDSDFAGFESYAYVLLIEQGLCGIIGNTVFFTSLIFFQIKQYRRSNPFGKKLIVLNISIVLTFLFFIFGTGDIGTFLFMNAIMGINLKVIMLSKKTKTQHDNFDARDITSLQKNNMAEA